MVAAHVLQHLLAERLLRRSNIVITTPWIASRGFSVGADLLDGLQQLAEPFEREKLALHGHENRIGRNQRVDRQAGSATADSRSARS